MLSCSLPGCTPTLEHCCCNYSSIRLRSKTTHVGLPILLLNGVLRDNNRSLHCLLCLLLFNLASLCRGFMTTELGCAGCRRIERHNSNSSSSISRLHNSNVNTLSYASSAIFVKLLYSLFMRTAVEAFGMKRGASQKDGLLPTMRSKIALRRPNFRTPSPGACPG